MKIDIKDLIVNGSCTLLKAYKILDKTHLGIVLVVDHNGVLIGTVTDGDIRRGILQGKKLTARIKQVMNSTPVACPIDQEERNVFSMLMSHGIRQIPIIDKRGRPCKLVHIDDFMKTEGERKNNFAIIMAGGFGRRLGNLTTNVPKPLLKVGDKPILELIVTDLIRHGFQNIIMCLNYKAVMIEDHFGDGKRFGAAIEYVRENEPLGTAGAIGLIKRDIDGPALVVNGDLLTKVNYTKLLQYHEHHKSDVTACVREIYYNIPYGVVSHEENRIKHIAEKPKQTFFVNAGIYVMNPDIFSLVPPRAKYNMTNLLSKAIKRGKRIYSYPIIDYWLDIGLPEDFQRAQVDYRSILKGGA